MKGIVFTELLDMIEDKFSYDMVDQLLLETDLPSGGTYTSIGTYDHTEMVNLVLKLSEKTGIPAADLLYAYGRHLFRVFSKNYAHFFAGASSGFDFLGSIHDYIHVEVRKLYPDAQLPHFDIVRESERSMRMIYSSDRKMSTLALGLIDECMVHFNEKVTVTSTFLTDDGSKVVFHIIKNE